MLRKTLIALTAAGTLALGMTSLSNTASANIVITVGGGHHYGWGHGRRHWHGGWYYGPRCFIHRVKVWHHHRWVWRTVRSCNHYPLW